MSTDILAIKPVEIEAKSFAIIEEEFHKQTAFQVNEFDAREFAVIQRVIHATGDFSFATNLQFHPEAIATAINNLKGGKNIVTDVNMVAAGINKRTLSSWGGEVICRIADPEVAEQAANSDKTRSEVSIESSVGRDTGIIAIGNAPTALLHIMKIYKKLPCRPVVIGVPVGFVNAAESKEILSGCNFPFITSLGRKGGSPVAAAMVNALMKLL